MRWPAEPRSIDTAVLRALRRSWEAEREKYLPYHWGYCYGRLCQLDALIRDLSDVIEAAEMED